MMSAKITRSVACAVAAAMLAYGAPTQATAAPLATAGSGLMAGESPIVEVGYKKRRQAHHRRARANTNAAIGAAIAIGVLGIAAAAAAQPCRGQYHVDNRYYPVDAWGQPIHGARPVQYYEPGYYYQQRPRQRTYRDPRWGGPQPAPYGYGYSRAPAYVDPGYGRGWGHQRYQGWGDSSGGAAERFRGNRGYNGGDNSGR
jgi:hypothetical protein